MIVALAIGLALGSRPSSSSPTRSPPLDGADPRRRPARAGQPLHLPLRGPRDRRHRRLSPAGRRRPAAEPNAEAKPTPSEACPDRRRSASDDELHQADRRRAGDTLADRERPSRSSTASRSPTSPSPTPCAGLASATSRRDHHSTRSLLHDGRQPWARATTAASGARPPRLDHRHRPSSPTGRPTGSGSSSRTQRRAGRRRGRRALPLRPLAREPVSSRARTRRAAVRLAGPLVAAAVLIDYGA